VAVYAFLQQAQGSEQQVSKQALALAEQLSKQHLQHLDDETPARSDPTQGKVPVGASKLQILASLLQLHLAVIKGDGPAVRALMQVSATVESLAQNVVYAGSGTPSVDTYDTSAVVDVPVVSSCQQPLLLALTHCLAGAGEQQGHVSCLQSEGGHGHRPAVYAAWGSME
jgi:hypothetical protein